MKGKHILLRVALITVMFFGLQSIEGLSESYIYLREDAREVRVDRETSALAYMLGETLRCSELLKNRESAQQYAQHSFELAFKYGISLEGHLEDMREIKGNPCKDMGSSNK